MTEYQKNELCGIMWLAIVLVMLAIFVCVYLDKEFGSADAGLVHYSERWDTTVERAVDTYGGAFSVVILTLMVIYGYAGLFVVVRETTKVLVSKKRYGDNTD